MLESQKRMFDPYSILQRASGTYPRSQSLRATAGRVALAITRQGSHRSVRARIRAYGSSTSRFAARKGPRSYSIELRGHDLEPRGVPHVALDRVCWLTLRFPP